MLIDPNYITKLHTLLTHTPEEALENSINLLLHLFPTRLNTAEQRLKYPILFSSNLGDSTSKSKRLVTKLTTCIMD